VNTASLQPSAARAEARGDRESVLRSGHHAWPALCRAGAGTIAPAVLAPADYVAVQALPSAGGRGYWLVGVLTQTGSYISNAGVRKAAWPDGATIGPERPALVHQGTDTYITTCTAIDPPGAPDPGKCLHGMFRWVKP
jgi:hypothetical protein